MTSEIEWRELGSYYWASVEGRSVGMVYEVGPHRYQVYLSTYGQPYARKHLCDMPTLAEAQALLTTITASQQL